MGYINRFLLFLYTLAIALAALGVIVLCLPVFPIPVILNETAFVLSRWETMAGAALVFILSVHLLACSFSGGSKHEEKKEQEPEAVVVHGAGGEVRVAVSAVSSLAEKSAAKVHGVENANAKVESRRVAGGEGNAPVSSVVIGLDLELGAGQNVAQVSDAVRAAVSEQMNEVLGLSDYSIDISIAEIAGREAAKKSRVS
ncbi:MAG: alkaline shock response membrane anchor protein AmaP [Schwartzia sp.]|nr:alkaline shock response membrane anchor protein AmaP [Schwartzia sp. (in: firmicutes)]MBQ9634272.1 alkaline shock response membrane anchor protein AmaP [Schwartzia sp. (in: firmicutes)]